MKQGISKEEMHHIYMLGALMACSSMNGVFLNTASIPARNAFIAVQGRGGGAITKDAASSDGQWRRARQHLVVASRQQHLCAGRRHRQAGTLLPVPSTSFRP